MDVLSCSGVSLDINELVSSANNRVMFSSLVLFAMSFVYIRKSRGPNTDPCGTP